jgi:LuxR family transcriptional regulator, quorum-sensing system regulator BjaR1
MDCIAEAARLARRIASEPKPSEIWREIKAFAAPFGFNHLTVLKCGTDLPQRLAPSIVYMDAPEGFAEEFDREGFGPQHPLILRALTQLEPFSASETEAAPLAPMQRHVLRQVAKSLNVRDGWTFPVGHEGTVRGVLMFGGREPNMSLLLRSVLHLLAHRAFLRSEELAGGALQVHGLTPRELECLRWVALGKTDAEMAVILSISPRTARFHVENAKLKLRAQTRIQAVAQAMRLNAIAA